ncbi:MAG TPA: hypothetical protein VG889_01330 [Rhizomicrobium sp.]|nr:hypothetical protein [Rhizomicrobium sp.]
MNKLALIAAAALLSTAAYADTVQVTSVTNISSPSATVTSMSSAAFKGGMSTVLTIGGKTCKWGGSASGSVPGGCNYQITVNNSTNALSNPVSTNPNPVCTASSQMLADCH